MAGPSEVAPGGSDAGGAAPAAVQPVPDLAAPGLRVLFCGINPGMRSAELGLHFARPGNRFWRVLHAAGFTDRVLRPSEQFLLPSLGLGITNLVDRPTVAAADLSKDELIEGGVRLAAKVEALRPVALAVVGLQAYRTAFNRKAALGRQSQQMGPSMVWVLPNPSGLQTRYQLPQMTAMFAELRAAVATSLAP